jgi:uncharacterized protein (DUF2236 family)
MAETIAATRADADVLTPLGPESLTWRYFGLMAGFAYGAVPQLLHPLLGHAVEEHSNVKDDPFDRLIRSMGPIYGVIYDGPEAATTAVAVRRFHEPITGDLPGGERYSALNPRCSIGRTPPSCMRSSTAVRPCSARSVVSNRSGSTPSHGSGTACTA